MKVKYITNLIILILITFCFTSFCLHQNIEGTNAFFQVKYPFIYSKPITIKLTKQDIIDYCFDFYNSEHPKKIVDSLFLLEMLSNDKKDTSNWNENEIKNCFLVNHIPISLSKVKLKLHSNLDTTSIIEYVNKINSSMNCDYGDRSKNIVSSVSKPIFDKSKSFALIQYNLLNCKNEGSSLVKLFKLKNNEWKVIDTINQIWKTYIPVACKQVYPSRLDSTTKGKLNTHEKRH